jgi:HSP20 family protein
MNVPWRARPWKARAEAGSPLRTLRWEMDRLIDRLVPESLTSWSWPSPLAEDASWSPPVDVAQSSQAIIVQAEVPGVPPESLELTLAGNEMVISGHKQQTIQQAGEDWCQTERRFGAFRRSIALPDGADPENAEAECRDGVLTVRFGKREAAPPQRISVRTQSTAEESSGAEHAEPPPEGQ